MLVLRFAYTRVRMHSPCRYQSNDSTFSAMPSSWRWQKRFFIFSDAQRTLYYFKNAEDVQKGGTARGLVRRRVLSVVYFNLCGFYGRCMCVPV